MSSPMSAKKLLSQYNQEQYRAFIINEDTSLSLEVISSVPGIIGAFQRKNLYKKFISHPGSDQHIKFITKDGNAHTFVWQTNAEQLKKAVRWGIIKTHSITSKVISALGRYRVTAHNRIAKGMISNSQIVKLKLLDLYQDRFEALQDLESLANRNLTAAECEVKLKAYILKIEHIKNNLSFYFSEVINQSGLDQLSIERIKKDLEEDIARTNSYINTIRTTKNIHSYTSAAGYNSLLGFVKERMVHGLYELQGINQDLTYNNQKEFALTRGELNDFIEDARKEIEDHRPDVCNAVTAKHHGLFSQDKEGLISYDFSEDELTPQRERDVLLAISFIEGWDQFDSKSLTVNNQYGSESLDVYRATRWKTHRNFKAFIKSLGFYIVNFFKSIFLSTKPWEEETWSNEQFHLIAKELREHSSSNEPLWQKPLNLFKQMGYLFFDVFNGIRDFGLDLVFKMPTDLINDWVACDTIPPTTEVLEAAQKEIDAIKEEEQGRLKVILEHYNIDPPSQNKASSQLAEVEYTLTAGEQNDILTAMMRGLNEFASIFSHDLYAKDPIGGLIFTAAFGVGAGAIYFPQATASIFSTAYVNWFSKVSYSIGSSKLAAVIAGGSTQAELFATGWDGLLHGPSGMAMNALYKVGEDPLTVGAYIATATGIGYVLVNGIAGYPIPLLSNFLKEDLGTVPEFSYPFIGAKIAILLYESLIINKDQHYPTPEISPELVQMARSLQSSDLEHQKIINRFLLVSWITTNAKAIPKLNPTLLFTLSRQIEGLFDKQQSKSLHKILYPETNHSIAYQLFTIPLSYVTAILRLASSVALSFSAWVSGKDQPMEAIKRASLHLYEKITRDLSRLIIFTTHFFSLVSTALSVLIKPIAFILGMLLGRIAALFDASPGHATHKLFASVHVFFKSISDFLYPEQVLKNTTSAHPVNTIMHTEDSYKKLLTQIGEVKPVSSEESPATNPEHFSLSFRVNPSNSQTSNPPDPKVEIKMQL